VAVAFSPNGKRLAAGTQERLVHVWDVATWQEVFQLGEHPLSVSSVAFSRDGGRLVSTCGGHIWPARKKPKPDHWPLRGDDLKTVPDLKVWDARTGEHLRTFPLPDKMQFLALSPDGEGFAVALADKKVRLCSTTTGTEVGTFEGHVEVPPQAATFSPDGKRLVSGGWDNEVRLWDATTRQEILTLRLRGVLKGVAFSPDGNKIVAAGYDEVRIWDGTPLN
jgi:WD40 repeat protein